MENYIGKKYGRMTILEVVGQTKNYEKLVRCKCDCGNEKVVRLALLKNGHTKSCGCFNSEKSSRHMKRLHDKGMVPHVVHGKSETALYRVWASMKARCLNPDEPAYPNYGGRGITVCEEWRDSFTAFYDWAIKDYRKGLTLDRMNVNGGYSPDNCRWVTRKEQARNKRNNVSVSQYDINGRFIRVWDTMGEAAENTSATIQNIWSCCNGRHKSAGGYIWRYYGNA